MLIVLLAYLSFVASIALRSSGDRQYSLPEESITNRLEARIPVLMKTYGIPGVSLALIQQGKTVWSQAYGYADLGTRRKMTVDTHCRVESISKSVTAWGIMKLVEQGQIELDKPVGTYIKNWVFPESRFSAENVTVRRLLSHNAGMPLGTIGVRYAPGGEIPSLEESLTKEAVLRQEPGSSFSYSNTGFDLLELLIEEVTGRDFAEYMAAEVLSPLGMRNSSFVWSEDLTPAVPDGHDVQGNPIPVYVYPGKASGGLFATVGDIAAFVAAGMPSFARERHEVLSDRSIRELHAPMVKLTGYYGLAFDAYGLGHFIEKLSDGKTAVAHGGQGSGWMTHFHFVPETGDGIVILTNSQRSWPFFAHVLSDWARWNGLPPLGMERILLATRMLWAAIGLLFALALWQIWRLGKGLAAGRRRLAPLAKASRLPRATEGCLAAALGAGLWWAANQDYLFISAVFPRTIGWLGCSLLLAAIVLLLSGLCPCLRNRHGQPIC
ncbi:MAG: serine hydrolase domain-containing protein [Patescibacteria group bacterium]